ncbi:minor tail protein [Corynebacterium phage SamW]|uniref:Minor tail protein n=3 Tax=Samwavirus TaxID=2733208 RepID=A0A385UG40_9CAUD|nr:minor tail protein [Corynebacterium phage SamW]YP_009848772.1 minor tail protein [Corynebacterium phage Dina]AYB70498.1 minor tail protein [Corynebacterium phage SamW]AYQ98793.1 minor tail protein [Corynebacterium phage Troy]QDF19705.1 minor tail protein [Corynebacterium phage Dina]
MKRKPISILVRGVDGSEWILSGPGRGNRGVVLAPEADGLIDPPVSTIWKSSATQIGSTYQAARYAARDLQLKLWIWDDDRWDWQVTDSLWRRAWSYERDSELIVRSDSGERRLRCRLSQTPEVKLGQEGGHAGGHTEMALSLRAGNPMWTQEDTTDVWRFDGIHYTGFVTVTNPTDTQAWVKYVSVGPASLILPDPSFEDREGWPGYEHRDRRVVLPFQNRHQNLLIDTDPMTEQVVSSDGSQFWARMNGQAFVYPVPPWTPPTRIPVAVNPLPWLPNLWARFGIPFDIPVDALVAMAEALTKLLEPLGTDTVLSWTPERLAQEIDTAIRSVLPGFVGEWADVLLEALSIPTLGEIIAEAWGSVATMAGSGVQVRVPMQWTRPYGMEL